MLKKLFLVLAMIIFFSPANQVFAELVINEFVSDPNSGSEWVELFNTSSAEVDLSGWKWTEFASPGGGTEHEGTPKNLSGTVPANGFFILEINSALNNTGDSIGIYNGDREEDRVTFGTVSAHSKDLDPPAKGKSGALIGGDWKTNQEPTKGEANLSSSVSGDVEEAEDGNENDNNESSGGNNSDKSAPVARKIYSPKVEITSGRVAYVGVPFLFEGTGTGDTGARISRGRYFWNFGDGDFREVKATTSEKFTHTYFYPGEHNVVFDYYADSFAEDPIASDQTVVKVIEPKIVISRVGEAGDFFIELTNETESSADISEWALLSEYKIYNFPRNTTIGSKKKMIISPKISNFSIGDQSTLKLMTKEREIVYDYSKPQIAETEIKTIKILDGHTPDAGAEEENDEAYVPEERSLTEVLPAFAFGALEGEEGESGSSNSLVIFVSLALLVFGAGAGVYFLRHPKGKIVEGDDFEILEE